MSILNLTNYFNTTTVYGFDISYLIEKRRQYYAISVPILLAYALLVFCLNAIVLLVVPFLRSCLSPTLKLVVSLGVADLWTSVTLSVSLTYNSYLYFVHNVDTSACVATVLEALKLGGFFSSILHLLALAVNHYLMTVYPFLCRKLMTSFNVKLILITAWLLPSTVILVGFASVPNEGFRTPGGTCSNLDFATTFEFRAIILCLICIFFTIITVLYVAVVSAVRRANLKSKRPRSHHITVTAYPRDNISRHRRTIFTALWMCGTFFVGWLPSSLMYFLMCSKCPYKFNDENLFTTVYIFGFLSNIFILSKSLANPIVYAVRIPEVRHVLMNWKLKLLPNDDKSDNNNNNNNIFIDKSNNNSCHDASGVLVTTGQEVDGKKSVVFVNRNTKSIFKNHNPLMRLI